MDDITQANWDNLQKVYVALAAWKICLIVLSIRTEDS
jgi:hypothetical protein